METTKAILDRLWHKLLPLRNMEAGKFQVFAGFDGFVDQIQKAVEFEQDEKNKYFNSIDQFSTQLLGMQQSGGSVEVVTCRTKYGGNAPILSNTLANLGIQTYCVGAMGYPDLHPVFLRINKLCELISVADPGENRVLEFNDAKLVFSEQSVFQDYDWDYLKSHAKELEQLKEIVAKSQLMALVDWANLPHATSIWKGFLEEFVKPYGSSDKLFFFHLGDPYKMSRKKIGETIELINEYAAYGKVSLSMNEKEAVRLWMVLNGMEPQQEVSEIQLPGIEDMTTFLFRVFTIETLLVRSATHTHAVTGDKLHCILGKKENKPRLLMGSGDNFDAGYCLGLLLGWSTYDRVLLGTAAAGAYMQTGHTPCVEDLIEYVKTWAEELGTDRPGAAKESLAKKSGLT